MLCKPVLALKKLSLKNDRIKTLHVPQYKNLTLNHIMDFASNHPKVFDFLPDEPDLPKIPKQWIVDICAAVIGVEFRDWVEDCKEERKSPNGRENRIRIQYE